MHPRTIPKLNIKINGNQVEQVTNFNFLRITIDPHLTWNDHISRIPRVIGIMNKLKHIFPHQILRIIYNCLIHPHFIYSLCIWGFSPKRLTILQKKAVRILPRRPYISILPLSLKIGKFYIKRPIFYSALQAVSQEY